VFARLRTPLSLRLPRNPLALRLLTKTTTRG
jgi:hypothetical protein